MIHYKIRGGIPLCGSVTVGGSKNAALPILFATVVTNGVSVIRNLPDIGDVAVALRLIGNLGARIERSGSTVTVDTRQLEFSSPDGTLTSAIRASSYLIGACLARFGRAELAGIGGCSFADRPIDMHLYAASCLGASVDGATVTADGLRGSRIDFRQPSVGATVNALIMASVADGETVITSYAREPHVAALADYLVSAGASIRFTDTAIYVRGRALSGGEVTVIGDMIEAGSYLSAAVATGGCLTVRGVCTDDLTSFLSFLTDLGVYVSISDSYVTVTAPHSLGRAHVTAAPYPGFPSDLQPIAAPLLALGGGGSIIDSVWRSRFGYLSALSAFGVRYRLTESGAVIYPSTLIPSHTAATDLRGGMACIITALAASGESTVGGAEHILRGYEDPVSTLSSLGASISCEQR